MSTPTAPHRGLPHTAGFSDGIGDRLLVFDPSAGTSLEVLKFKAEFAESPEFEAAVLARIEALNHVQHPSLATVHGLERDGDRSLSLISRHTPGKRVSELLPKAHGPAFALELIRLVTPALAALHRAGDDVAHGVLSAERIIVTRDGRLVVVESVLGAAIESLAPSRAQLHELGLIVPAGADAVQFTAKTDLAQLGFIALSLLLGRRIDPADYPDRIPALLDEFSRTAGSPTVAAKLRGWLERAMQLSPRSFSTVREAQAAINDLPDDMEVQAASAASAMDAFPSEDRPAVAQQVKTPEPLKPSSAMDSNSRAATASAAATALKKNHSGGSKSITSWVGVVAAVILLGGGAAYFLKGSGTSAETAHPQTPANAPVSTAALTTTPISSPVATPVTTPLSTPAPTPVSTLQAPSTSPATLTKPEPKTAPPPASSETTTAPLAASTSPATAGTTAQATGQRFGGVKIASPLEMQMFENGTLLGSSAAPVAINEGTHNVELVNETVGFRLRQTLTVKPGQLTTLNIAVPNSKISINAVPWAEVEIDGKPAGETPLANLSLPIGTHEITFKHPELGVRKQTVVVKVDGQTRVTQVFDKDKFPH